ncbi:hypothetical protein ABG067_009596, partial [Albugo candida]
KESIQKLESEKAERQRSEKKLNKLSLGGLTDEEMLDYAMMLSKQENEVPIIDEPEADVYIDEDDEELMKAVIASLDMAEKENGFNFEEGSNINHDSN